MALSAGYGTVLAMRGGGQRNLARRATKMRPGARGQSQPTAVASIDLRRDVHGGLDLFARRVLPRSVAISEHFAETGMEITIGRYALICLILAVAIDALLVVRRVPALAAVPLGIVAGLWLPYLATGWLVKRRRKKFTKLWVQRETGGVLAETLQNLQSLLLKRENMRLKIKTMSSEALATASIIGILPHVIMGVLYVVSLTYIMTLFTALGPKLAGGAAFSLSLGVFVMVRMIRFDI
jgi:Flp pilus assembly protein TadB